MAEIITSAGRSKRRQLRHFHVDMTPLVDLGFLLITFFMLTTHLIDQRVMDSKLPLTGNPTLADNTLTILLDARWPALWLPGFASTRAQSCSHWMAVH